MTTGSRSGRPLQISVQVFLDDRAQRSLPSDVREGLARVNKSIPPKHFYDARGSQLFEQITCLPEYYPTRAEREILSARGAQIAQLTQTRELVELGSGAAEKALLLIDPMIAAGTLRSYVPVDVSESALREAAEAIATVHPELEIRGAVADMTRHLRDLPQSDGGRTVALLGGTIGNFRPADRAPLIAAMADLAGPDGFVLIGFDKVKEPDVLVAAYDDAQGVTAEFNLNLLNVINRELNADFPTADFDHVAVWDAENEWIEMRLRAKHPLTVRIGDLDMVVDFQQGEELLTETSAKFTRSRVEGELAEAGLQLSEWFEDSQGRFALALSRG
jgi:L-histidine N-alpha-methyltransferase